MPIHVERRDGASERAALAAIAYSGRVVAAVVPRWRDDFFPGRPARTLARLCVEYAQLYERPVGKWLAPKVRAWVETAADPELANLVVRLAEDVVREGPPGDEDAALYAAAEFFERGRLESLAAGITQDLARGAPAAAQERVAKSQPVDFSPAAGIDVLADDEPWKAVFAARRRSMVELPDGLREFYENDFHDGAFVAWMAKFKGGKSFAIQDLAWRMVEQGVPTAYFECGDSTEPDVLTRWAVRILRRPLILERESKNVRRPLRVIPPPGDPTACATVESEHELVYGDIKFEDVRDALDAHLKKTGPGVWRLSCHAAGTMSVAKARQTLEEWERRSGVKIRCIAAGSMVLTDSGLVSIENVSKHAKLWDGRSWVSHGGVVYKGRREVITYAGLTATPDHRVWTEEGWRTLESCRRLRRGIAHTGEGGQGIRIGADYIFDHQDSELFLSTWNANSYRSPRIRLCEVCQMRVGEVGLLRKYPQGGRQGVSGVPRTEVEVPYESLVQSSGYGQPVQRPQIEGLASVWGARNSVPIHFQGARLRVDHPEFGCAGCGRRDRSGGQRGALRAGQPAIFNSIAESVAYAGQMFQSASAQIPHGVPRGRVFGSNRQEVVSSGAYCTSDSREVEHHAALSQEAEVYDIVNAGPFHCFTVQGLLVHNCALFDYADLLKAPPGIKERRDVHDENWRQLRTLSQEMGIFVGTVTQANRGANDAWVLTRDHVSEDIRKLAHVTALYGINQTGDELKAKVKRLNCIVNRHRHYDPNRCCYTAGNLSYGDPFAVAAFPDYGGDDSEPD